MIAHIKVPQTMSRVMDDDAEGALNHVFYVIRAMKISRRNNS